MATDDDWMTVQEAAKLSGYHPEYITQLARQDRIKGRKVSIVWLIDRKSLLAYMKSAKAGGQKRGPKTTKSA